MGLRVALVGFGLALVVTRIAGMSRSLWYDEAFTANRYVRRGSTIFDPEMYNANNHVLYSLSSWASARLFGTDEAVLRLPVVIPALLATGLLVWWCWRHWSPPIAVAVLALTVLSPVAGQLHTEARGYGLVLLASVVLLVAPPDADRDRVGWGHDLAVAAAGVIGTLTFPPVVALQLATTGTWLIRRRANRIRLVVLTAAAGATTLLVLRPLLAIMLEGADRVGSRHADPISWTSPILAPLRILGGQSLDPLLPGGATLPAVRSPASSTAAMVAASLAVILGIIGLVAVWRQRRELFWYLVAGLAGSLALLGVLGFHLLDRYLAFLLPHVIVLLAAGLVTLLGLVPAARPQRWVTASLLVVLVLASIPGLRTMWALTTEPRQNFAGAAEQIEASEPAVLVARNLHVGWAWYLDPDRVERAGDADEADELFCDGPRPAIYLPNPGSEPEDGPSCLDEAQLLQVPERSSDEFMRWYLLE